jgi:lipopolysaccharide export system permease protein
MPWLLYRYMIGELLRVIGLTCAVLVTVIAFGATIKPLANETLLDASQTVKYLMLAIVPMLQFALPFAAGFGTTITLHRFAAENEILAMAASGISYRRIVAPLLVLGAILTLIMIVLTQDVIPRFWGLIERTLAVDVPRLFQASIEKGVPFQIPNSDLQIVADRLVVEHQPADTSAGTRLRLYRVAAAVLDDQGRIVTDVTAAQAVVDVHRQHGRTYLKLAMTDAVAYKPDTGELIETRSVSPDRALIVPSATLDRPKSMTRSQLLHLREHPDDFVGVIRAKNALAEAIRLVETRMLINERLRSSGQVILSQGGEDDLTFVIRADELGPERFLSHEGRALELEQYRGPVAQLRIRPRAMHVTPHIGGPFDELTFDLELKDSEVVDLAAGGAANQRASLDLLGLMLAGDDAPPVTGGDLSSIQLISLAESLRDEGGGINQRIKGLTHEIGQLNREIRARLANRYALSVTAALLLILGGVLAMWLRTSMPLTIYLWAFLPAIVDLILISAGEQLMRDDRLLAPYVMWSGNAVLFVLLLAAYVRLGRN